MRNIIFVTALVIASRQALAPADAITPLGIWKGTSICTANRGICHDETVVYHVKDVPTGSRTNFDLTANKIVNGEEEFMATLSCHFDVASHILRCPMNAPRGRGVWEFTVTDTHMSGTLVVEPNTLYRKIEVDRA